MGNIFETLISQDRYQYIKLHVFPIIENSTLPICEVGVYKGGSLSFFATHFPKREIIGIDTFEGLPDPSKEDVVTQMNGFTGHQKGDFGGVGYKELKSLFAEHFENVTLIKGFFPNRHVLSKIKNKRFCFVHIDCDLYHSVKDCCEYFYPVLERKGIMVFDDYGFKSTPGAKVAVDEYFDNKTDCIKRALPTNQYFVMKT